MCGIVGFTGKIQAAPILLNGLAKLEYRGYDSAGIAVGDETEKDITIIKAKGRLGALAEKTDGGRAAAGRCGIGHIRWATHGEPSEANAHPHCTDDRSVVIVHNGIIENYRELREMLARSGYRFYSQTDTEVAAKLIDFYYRETKEPLVAITRAMLRLRGSYAFGIMFADFPGIIYAARKDSPLIVALNGDGSFIASDVPAVLGYSRSVFYLGNMEIAELTAGGVRFFNVDREEIEKQPTEIAWDADAAEKGGYEHFMIKEIMEQPEVIGKTLSAYIRGESIDLSEIGLDPDYIKSLKRVCMVACGSAYHVAVAAKYVMEQLTDLPVETDLASEFRYRDPRLTPDTLVIIISQSGETADSLAALRLAKEKGARTLGIVNVVGSSAAREADGVMYTLAGPEIAVATTKAYSAQLVASYLLAAEFARLRESITAERYAQLIAELKTLPEKTAQALREKEKIQWLAAKFANAKDIFFIGRGLDYAISLEGSLKMKEVSYIHSEAYAAGELKHGTISLIEEGTPVVASATQTALYEKTLNNMIEVKSRGAYLMGLTTYGNFGIEGTVDFTVYVPRTDPLFAVSTAIIPLQLLGYYVGVARGLDVDKPRNLAKSVTVE